MTQIITIVYKAKGQEDNTMVEVCRELPPEFHHQADGGVVYQRDAEFIGEALRSSLPGGTFDQLAAWILRAKASDLVVSYGSLDKPASVRPIPKISPPIQCDGCCKSLNTGDKVVVQNQADDVDLFCVACWEKPA